MIGLEKYKKGRWTNISRYVVKTRTPAQVASHAQNYYKHLAALNKDKRKSIDDVKTLDNEDVSPPHDQVHLQNDNVYVPVDLQNDEVHLQNDDVYVRDSQVDVQNDEVHPQNDDVYVPDYQVDQPIFADLDFLNVMIDTV